MGEQAGATRSKEVNTAASHVLLRHSCISNFSLQCLEKNDLLVQFYCISTTAAGIAATAGFTEICHQSSEALTDSQPGGECAFGFCD